MGSPLNELLAANALVPREQRSAIRPIPSFLVRLPNYQAFSVGLLSELTVPTIEDEFRECFECSPCGGLDSVDFSDNVGEGSLEGKIDGAMNGYVHSERFSVFQFDS